MKHRECDNVGPIDFESRNYPPTSTAVESRLSGLLWNVSFCKELPLGVCSSSYRVLSRTSLIKVSAEDNRTRLRFQLRTIGHITLVGCARNREGGCSILHSSHWDSLEDLSQTSGSGQVFFRTDLVCCGISPRFPLGNRKEVEIVFTLSHIWLLT